MLRDAEISDCGLYRYVLMRKWAEGPMVTFVMLNPSTADASIDDPTVRRCIGFAQREGFGSLAIVNLTPYRATKPVALQDATVPLRDSRGETYISLMAERSEKVIVAWGAWGQRWPGLANAAVKAVGDADLWCLGTTKSGQPKHPLYLKKTTPLERWEAP